MRMLVALAVCLALAVAGVIGFVVHREQQRGHAGAAPPAGGSVASAAAVLTISTGEPVDVAAHAPRQGLTVVMFTADF